MSTLFSLTYDKSLLDKLFLLEYVVRLWRHYRLVMLRRDCFEEEYTSEFVEEEAVVWFQGQDAYEGRQGDNQKKKGEGAKALEKEKAASGRCCPSTSWDRLPTVTLQLL
jgi:hypothetical protein